MHILIDAVGMRDGGAAAVLLELFQWLPKARPDWRWTAYVLKRSLRSFDIPETPGVQVIETDRGDSGVGRLLWVNRRLKSVIAEHRADALLSLANIGPMRPTVPQVVMLHQPLIFDLQACPTTYWKLYMIFMRWWILGGARPSGSIMVQTPSMLSRLLAFEPSLKGRAVVIPSGFRTPSPSPRIRPEKEALIDGASRPRLVYISLIRLHKNHLGLIEALPRILAQNPSASLILTADPGTIDADNIYAQAVVRRARELKVLDRIVWAGLLTPDEVNDALEKSDLHIFPSLAESFGLPLVETIALHRPLAASDAPYAREVAQDAAVYFDPKDPGNLADVVNDCLGHPQKLESLKSASARLRPLYEYKGIADAIAGELSKAKERWK